MSGLGTAGQGLYDQVTALYDLSPTELQALTMAAESADELVALEAQLEQEDSVMVAGSMGQTRVNPLFGEVRAHRALIASLLARLRVADEEASKARSDQARTAARARWDK